MLVTMACDCLNETCRGETYPWLDCHGDMVHVKKCLDAFIDIPDDVLRYCADEKKFVVVESELHRVTFRNPRWDPRLSQGRSYHIVFPIPCHLGL